MDIFSYDLLIFPIHLGIHWCLAAADLRHKTIRYYDSLGGKNFQCPKVNYHLQISHCEGMMANKYTFFVTGPVAVSPAGTPGEKKIDFK